MHPLRFQGRPPRSGLRLIDIFVKPTSACHRLVGVFEHLLGTLCRVCQVQGGGRGAPVPGALEVVPCRARGGQLVPLPRGWRELASRRPRVRWGWSVFFSARTGESTIVVGESGWRYGAPSSVSSPESASGGSSRLESRDLERTLPVSWASRLACVEDLSLPRVARFLTGLHVACYL